MIKVSETVPHLMGKTNPFQCAATFFVVSRLHMKDGILWVH